MEERRVIKELRTRPDGGRAKVERFRTGCTERNRETGRYLVRVIGGSQCAESWSTHCSDEATLEVTLEPCRNSSVPRNTT